MSQEAEHDPPLVGVIGLGTMGGAIARALHRASTELIVYDVRSEALEAFAESGIRCGRSLADLAQCDLVAVIVNNDRQVIDVVEELGPQLRRDATIIIHSTVLPATMFAAAESAGAHGVEVIDAPVSGGPPAVDRAELTVMVGGTASAVERCGAELSVLGPVHHIGELGAGQAVKLINDLLQASSWIMTLQCMDIARAVGIPESRVAEITMISTGASWTMANLGYCDQALLTHTLAANQDELMQFMSKDVRAALALARDAGLDVPLVETVAEFMEPVLARRLAQLQSDPEFAT